MSAPEHSVDCLVKGVSSHLGNTIGSSAQSDRVVVAIGGAGGLGKSRFASLLADDLSASTTAAIFPLDGYLLPRRDRARLGIATGDDPMALDLEGVLSDLRTLLEEGESVRPPEYRHDSGTLGPGRPVSPTRVLILDGTHSLYPHLVGFSDVRIALVADYATRRLLRRRVDIEERGYSQSEFTGLERGYERAYDEFIRPSELEAHMRVRINSAYAISAVSVALGCFCRV